MKISCWVQSGTNWYIYVNNNPLSFKDPTGLKKTKNTSVDLDKAETKANDFLKTVNENPDNYTIKAYERKAFSEKVPDNMKGLLKHSFYAVENNETGEITTLSYNAPKGRVLMNTGTDQASLKQFNDLGGKSNVKGSWMTKEVTPKGGIDTFGTSQRMLNVTGNKTDRYRLTDHIFNRNNKYNCNSFVTSTMYTKSEANRQAQFIRNIIRRGQESRPALWNADN